MIADAPRVEVMQAAVDAWVAGQSLKHFGLTSDERMILASTIETIHWQTVEALRARAAELFMELERRRIAE